MWRSRWRCVIKPAYSVSFLLWINIFVWQNVPYFPNDLRSINNNTQWNKFSITTSSKSFTCSNWKHGICSLLRSSKPVEFWERHSFLTLMQLLNLYWLHGVQKCSRVGWQCFSMSLKSRLVSDFVIISLSLVLPWRQSSAISAWHAFLLISVVSVLVSSYCPWFNTRK